MIELKEKKKIFAIFLFVLSILVFLIFLNISLKKSKKVYWYEVDGSYVYLYHNLTELKEVPFNLTINLAYWNIFRKYDKVYFIIDPNLKGNFTLGFIQIQAEFLYPLKEYGMEIIEACLYNTTECYKKKVPILKCKEVKDGLCIEYREGNLGIFQINKNYIIISGSDENILKATDLLIAKFYGLS